MPRVAVASIAAIVLAVAAVVTASAQSQPPTGWDGTNPFACTLQQAGFGAEVPDPGADPYCVEFDKRRQNVTQGGVVEFLLLEPARVAAASPRCFYFQSDHWRGSVVQEDGSTKTYEWDGHYFFDKARGEGGVWVTNFNINGRTADPSVFPGMPAEYGQHFGPGTGGVTTRNEVEADPRCAAQAAARSPYAADAAVAAGAAGTPPRCHAPAGQVGTNRVGAIRLGTTEADLRRALGAPVRLKRGFLRFCLKGGGKFMAGLAADRTGDTGPVGAEPVVVALTTSPALRVRGIGRGSKTASLRRRFPKAKRRLRIGRTHVYELRPGLAAGVTRGRVRLLMVGDPADMRSARALRGWLRRAR